MYTVPNNQHANTIGSLRAIPQEIFEIYKLFHESLNYELSKLKYYVCRKSKKYNPFVIIFTYVNDTVFYKAFSHLATFFTIIIYRRLSDKFTHSCENALKMRFVIGFGKQFQISHEICCIFHYVFKAISVNAYVFLEYFFNKEFQL